MYTHMGKINQTQTNESEKLEFSHEREKLRRDGKRISITST